MAGHVVAAQHFLTNNAVGSRPRLPGHRGGGSTRAARTVDLHVHHHVQDLSSADVALGQVGAVVVGLDPFLGILLVIAIVKIGQVLG